MTANIETLWLDHQYDIASYIGKHMMRYWGQETVEDLVSTVFLRAMIAISHGNGSNTNERGWLFAIARSVMWDFYRALQHKIFIDWDSLKEEPDSTPTPYKQAETALIRERVLFAVSHLGESYPQLLELRMEGYRFAEIAEILDMTTAAAKQRGTRAYGVLREPIAGLSAFLEEEAA